MRQRIDISYALSHTGSIASQTGASRVNQHPRRSHAAAAERDFFTQQVRAASRPLIAVAEVREIEFEDLTKEERDSFFGSFFETTEHAQLQEVTQ
jgi:hypothetical protein